MSTLSVVSRILRRLAMEPLPNGGDLGEKIELLRRELNLFQDFFQNGDAIISEDAERKACQLLHDNEDAVEYHIIHHQHSATSATTSWIDLIINKIGFAMMGSTLCSPAAPESDGGAGNFAVYDVTKIHEFHDLLTAGVMKSSRLDDQLPPHDPVIVGMDHYADRLVGELLRGTSDLSVIPICGEGGVGKTTLAHLVYNSDSVQRHFDIRAWAYVGDESKPRDILERMLMISLSGSYDKEGSANLEVMDLMVELYKIYFVRKFLFVLDDVRSKEDWDAIKFAFPDEMMGSRVIITTRDINLARYVATCSSSVLQMLPLNETESWELLKNKSGLADEEDHSRPGGMQTINQEKEEIGQQLVRYCGGLPSALTTIGSGLLEKSVEYWAVMLHTLEESNTSAQDILALLSYLQLRSHQKLCFLYLGQFPRDNIISLDKLYSLWMAEGLILTGGYEKTEMEVAEGYLNDLVYRNLVISEGNVEVSMSSPFRVNDKTRDFCRTKGKLEGFLEVIDFRNRDNNLNSLTCRLVVYLGKYSPSSKDTNGDALSDVVITEPKHIRSIRFFDEITTDDEDDHESIMPEPTQPIQVWADLTKFQWTRVLGFDGVDFRVKNLLMGIEKLIYLRYLSFYGCYLQEFPSSLISNSYYFLESLDLRISVSCVMIIPNVLNKLSKLRYLYFPLAFQSSISCDKLKIENLGMLEVLENFHTGRCDSNDLFHLNELRVFTGFVDGKNTDLENTVTSLNRNMRNLHHSSLVVKNFDTYSEKRRMVVAATLESDSVYALDIEGHLGELPCRAEMNGSKLRDIVFNGSEFRVDPMPILGKLPNLRSLVMCDDAFVGKEIVLCSGSDFPQLTSLKLATLRYLERLEVKKQEEEGEDKMQLTPKLVRLTIEQCAKMKTLPSQLGNVTTLKEFLIGSMPQEFRENVSKMVEEMQRGRDTETKVTFYD